jgi:hypothetical protein
MFRVEGIFEARPIGNSWGDWNTPIAPSPQFIPAWEHDVDRQKAFGIGLARGLDPFSAALEALGDDTGGALWAAKHWLSEPAVIAARDAYAQVVDTASRLLDKDAFSVKLLKLADEKDASGRFYANEASDRIKALELYAKIQGFITKEAANVINNNNANNEMKIILVEAAQEKVEEKIQETKVLELEDFTSDLKLVG